MTSQKLGCYTQHVDDNNNSDTMNEDLRRSKRQRKATSFGDDFYTYLVDNDPTTFVESISAPDAKQWDNAIRTETELNQKNNTWTLVDLPKGAKPIGCKWIFKKKYHSDGSIEKYKARLVAKALAVIHKLVIHQMDAKATFLNGDLKEEIYMTQPEGCVVPGQEEKPQYAQIIGSLLHLMNFSRPDITYVVGRLSRYTQRPNQEHWDTLSRLMRYLRCSMDYAIKYSGFPAIIEGYSDANWISDSDETKSTSGYIFTLGGCAITWRSARQTIIPRSIMESEFVSIEMAGNETEWLKNFLANIPLEMKPTLPVSIHCDFESAIVIATCKQTSDGNPTFVIGDPMNKPPKEGQLSSFLLLRDSCRGFAGREALPCGVVRGYSDGADGDLSVGVPGRWESRELSSFKATHDGGCGANGVTMAEGDDGDASMLGMSRICDWFFMNLGASTARGWFCRLGCEGEHNGSGRS
ncbi:hypothetical protein V8G54_030416 [Vigna mungo]|uniref:Reverse transcriptase Ty1/copia-type domain-containing protein n=1 Tax=Vigna mungo TaxID=3915 RepID=A0AAQ3MWR0_VIGMU